MIYNFGREDTANRDALQRLVASVTRFLDPDAALAAVADGLEFTQSRPLGGTWVLDGLWARFGIGTVMQRLLKGRWTGCCRSRIRWRKRSSSRSPTC